MCAMCFSLPGGQRPAALYMGCDGNLSTLLLFCNKKTTNNRMCVTVNGCIALMAGVLHARTRVCVFVCARATVHGHLCLCLCFRLFSQAAGRQLVTVLQPPRDFPESIQQKRLAFILWPGRGRGTTHDFIQTPSLSL